MRGGHWVRMETPVPPVFGKELGRERYLCVAHIPSMQAGELSRFFSCAPAGEASSTRRCGCAGGRGEESEVTSRSGLRVNSVRVRAGRPCCR
jgi:hypothetical protein